MTVWLHPLSEYNHYHDQRGRFAASNQVGITSQRPPGEPGHQSNQAVFSTMRDFAAALKQQPGVSNVSVSPGVGVWEGSPESTWVVSFRGDATKFLAQTGKRFNQDGVLLMRGCRGGGCDPSAEITFSGGMSATRRADVHQAMQEHGIGGGTWYKSGGKTVLRMVSVPAWGGDRAAHLASVRDISKALTAGGFTHTLRVKGVRTSVLTRENYDSVIGGRS